MPYWLVCGVSFLALISGSIGSTEENVCRSSGKSFALLDMAEDCVSKAKLYYPSSSDASKISDPSDCGNKAKSLTYLEYTKKLISEAKENLPTYVDTSCGERPRDCSEVLANGHNRSGVYTIYPISRYTVAKSVNVYCDMDTDGGGWTVIQRRGNFPPQADFYLDWQAYKTGFGSITREFWLGNDNIYALSNQGPCEIRFDLQDKEGNRRFAVYKNFRIGDESSSYTLYVEGYNGDAGDGFTYHNGKKFSTKDKGNTGYAQFLHGAFWHLDFAHVHLNGVYQPGKESPKSIHWHAWHGNIGLAFTEMKVRLR